MKHRSQLPGAGPALPTDSASIRTSTNLSCANAFFVWTLQANRWSVKRGPLAVKFLVGNYQLLLPFRTVVTPKVSFPPEDNFGHASTHWEIQLGKYILFVHLDALQEPKDFNGFSLMVWRKPADMKPLEINGIRGMVCGDYDSHYWSMWWHLKKGDLMLCIASTGEDPCSQAGRRMHENVINSITYVTAGSQ